MQIWYWEERRLDNWTPRMSSLYKPDIREGHIYVTNVKGPKVRRFVEVSVETNGYSGKEKKFKNGSPITLSAVRKIAKKQIKASSRSTKRRDANKQGNEAPEVSAGA